MSRWFYGQRESDTMNQRSVTRDDEFLNIEAAADAVSGTVHQIRCMIRRGDLPIVKIGRLVRIKRSELDAYVERRTVGKSLVDANAQD